MGDCVIRSRGGIVHVRTAWGTGPGGVRVVRVVRLLVVGLRRRKTTGRLGVRGHLMLRWGRAGRGKVGGREWATLVWELIRSRPGVGALEQSTFVAENFPMVKVGSSPRRSVGGAAVETPSANTVAQLRGGVIRELDGNTHLSRDGVAARLILAHVRAWHTVRHGRGALMVHSTRWWAVTWMRLCAVTSVIGVVRVRRTRGRSGVGSRSIVRVRRRRSAVIAGSAGILRRTRVRVSWDLRLLVRWRTTSWGRGRSRGAV